MTKRQRQYQKYLKSEHWSNLRYSVLKRDGFKCVKCGSIENLQAHHLLYRAHFEDSIEEDLISVCRPCHESIHKIKKRKPREKSVVYKKKQRVPFRRLEDGSPVIGDWKSLCIARSKRMITRIEFVKIRDEKFPHRKNPVKKKKKKGWWIGMYEGVPCPS